jgi:glycosyltransferase involved in cell wall biosynthesis
MQDFSVAMCVYHKDDVHHFQQAVESIYNKQTLKPSEIVIVVDGPIYDDLDKYVQIIENQSDTFKVVRLTKNLGHAGARSTALNNVSHELVALMDADDIANERRFEYQIRAFEKNPKAAIIGGQIAEFIEIPTNIVGSRIVPCNDGEIKQYLKSRCPFNQMTVMFRRSKVLQVGNYLDWYCNEDYYLWIRMVEAGLKFANLPETLVNVRVGKEMYARRGGWKYFKSEANLQGYMFKHGIISFPRYCFNVAVRFGVQVAMPNQLRGLIFQKLFRNQKTDNK